MKKYLLFFISAVLLTACRPQSDDLLSFGQNDNQAFAAASHSYAGQFRTFWLAMNENYCMWDYEAEHGLDWDKVYDTYMPRFEAMDDTTKNKQTNNFTKDSLLYAVYSEIVDSLHDGHTCIQIKNLRTGKYFSLFPGRNRVLRERGANYTTEGNVITTLKAYQSKLMDENYKTIEFDEVGLNEFIYDYMEASLAKVRKAIAAYRQSLVETGSDDWQLITLLDGIDFEADKILRDLKQDMGNNASYIADIISYNTFCMQNTSIFRMLNCEISQVENTFANNILNKITYALFNGNIAYLRIDGFGLTPNLLRGSGNTDKKSLYYAYQAAVDFVWKKWFDNVQTLHIDGQLGGVIIDVRNNNGGYLNDYQYVLGALLPSGGFESHYLRVKNGVGRYDFGPIVPFVMSTYEGEHEVIDDCPIVVIANSRSVSMAENTAWGAKKLSNGTLVGTRTFGGLSALNVNPADYSSHYSGAFGEENVTPIYGYIPKYVCLYGEDKHLAEGIGMIPDIEVVLDSAWYATTGRDTQLEAAIDCIIR